MNIIVPLLTLAHAVESSGMRSWRGAYFFYSISSV